MADLKLYVFHSNKDLSLECIQAGVNGIIVDLEFADKRHRQSLYNTQINRHDFSTLKEVKSIYDGTLICRVNGGENLAIEEIEQVLDLGATDIMLPMVRKAQEVEKVLRHINGRARCLVMIETPEAIQNSIQIGELPIDHVYVGLNDLAIARGDHNIFVPMIDGTMDELRRNIPVDFGIAGLTHPERGTPVPSHLLMNELMRLNCQFTLLRRSFFKDAEELGVGRILSEIRSVYGSNDQFDSGKTETFRELVKGIRQKTI